MKKFCKWGIMDWTFVQVDVTGYLACRIAGRGILDEKILGEALSRVEGLYKGIPHYLP